MTDPAVEIRRNDDGSIDEIVAKGCDVHIEQLDDIGFGVGIELPDGRYWRFWIGAKNNRSHVELCLTEAATADVIP